MSSPARSPQQLLDALGDELQSAFARRVPRRRRRGWRRGVAALAVVVALGASTAAATRSIFSSAPPLPRLAPAAAILATDHPAGWQLSVSRCSRPARAVSLLLRTSVGGAGSACGPLIAPATTFYDPAARHSFAFGAVPASARRVELVLGRARRDAIPIPADADALHAARLPGDTYVYVVAIPATATVTAVTAFDGSGHLVLACQEQRCTTP